MIRGQQVRNRPAWWVFEQERQHLRYVRLRSLPPRRIEDVPAFLRQRPQETDAAYVVRVRTHLHRTRQMLAHHLGVVRQQCYLAMGEDDEWQPDVAALQAHFRPVTVHHHRNVWEAEAAALHLHLPVLPVGRAGRCRRRIH